jgi:hypothetical protein
LSAPSPPTARVVSTAAASPLMPVYHRCTTAAPLATSVPSSIGMHSSSQCGTAHGAGYDVAATVDHRYVAQLTELGLTLQPPWITSKPCCQHALFFPFPHHWRQLNPATILSHVQVPRRSPSRRSSLCPPGHLSSIGAPPPHHCTTASVSQPTGAVPSSSLCCSVNLMTH